MQARQPLKTEEMQTTANMAVLMEQLPPEPAGPAAASGASAAQSPDSEPPQPAAAWA